jgi:thymidine phosphorylase
MEVTHQLSGAMIYLGGKSEDISSGVQISKEMIKSGQAWNKFLQIVKEQNGKIDIFKNIGNYPDAKYINAFTSPESGWVELIDAYETGMVSVQLGAGRQKSDDSINFTAGIRFHAKTGEKVKKGQVLFTIYTDREDITAIAAKRLLQSIKIAAEPLDPPKLILKYLDKTDL